MGVVVAGEFVVGSDGKEDGVSLVTAGALILKELIIFKAVGSNVENVGVSAK